MKSQPIQNVLCNLAAGLIAFTAASSLQVTVAQSFGLLTAIGISLIALHDYTPRRQVQLKLAPAQPVTRPLASRRSSSRPNVLLAA